MLVQACTPLGSAATQANLNALLQAADTAATELNVRIESLLSFRSVLMHVGCTADSCFRMSWIVHSACRKPARALHAVVSMLRTPRAHQRCTKLMRSPMPRYVLDFCFEACIV